MVVLSPQVTFGGCDEAPRSRCPFKSVVRAWRRLVPANMQDDAQGLAKRGNGCESGHSHDGQISPPLLGPRQLPPLGREHPERLQAERAASCRVYPSR